MAERSERRSGRARIGYWMQWVALLGLVVALATWLSGSQTTSLAAVIGFGWYLVLTPAALLLQRRGRPPDGGRGVARAQRQ